MALRSSSPRVPSESVTSADLQPRSLTSPITTAVRLPSSLAMCCAAASPFLYCGRFSDYENTFQILDGLDFVVELNDMLAVGVLQSKDWFDWGNGTKPLA